MLSPLNLNLELSDVKIENREDPHQRYILKKELANYIHGPNWLSRKFHKVLLGRRQNHLFVVYDFHATVTRLSSYDTDCLTKPKILTT